MIATVSAIGAPAAIGWEMRPGDYVRALRAADGGGRRADRRHRHRPERLLDDLQRLGRVGRARHASWSTPPATAARTRPARWARSGSRPTTTTRPSRPSPGGNRAENRYLEVVTRGTVRRTANVLRTASDMSGGFISCARNPLPASFVAEHAAVGAISFALSLGESILAAETDGPEAMIDATAEHLGGRILERGPVRGKDAADRERVRHRHRRRRRARAGVRQRVPDRRVGRRAAGDLPRRARRRCRRRPGGSSRSPTCARATRSRSCTCPRPTCRSATASGAERLPRGRGDARQAAGRVRARLNHPPHRA